MGEIVQVLGDIEEDVKVLDEKVIKENKKKQTILNESLKSNTILETWKNQQDAERKLRKTYAICLLTILAIQLIFICALIILIGCQVLSYEKWLIRLFISSIFAEIVGMVYVIVRYLFKSSNTADINHLMENLK